MKSRKRERYLWVRPPNKFKLSSLILALLMILNPVTALAETVIPLQADQLVEGVLIDNEPIEFDRGKSEYIVELKDGVRYLPEVEFELADQIDKSFELQRVTNVKTIPFTDSLIIKKDGLVEKSYTVKFTKNIDNIRRVTELVTPENIYLYVGEEFKLNHSTNEDASVQIVGYELPLWEDPNMPNFDIDERGNITALEPGSSILKVESRDRLRGESPKGIIYKEVAIHVLELNEAKAESIEVSETKKTIEVGEEYQIDYKVLPSNSSSKLVVWKTTDEQVAYVNQQGLVVAKSPGIATVKGYNPEYGLTVDVQISVVEKELSYIRIKPAQIVLGEKEKLDFETYPEGVGTGELTWISSNPEIATISSTGTIEALQAGKVEIKLISSKGPWTELEIEISEQGDVSKELVEEPPNITELIGGNRILVEEEKTEEDKQSELAEVPEKEIVIRNYHRDTIEDYKGFVVEGWSQDNKKDSTIYIERVEESHYKSDKRTNNDYTIPPPVIN